MMYERRIESSMYKTMNKLKQLQVMRRIEKADAEQRTAETAAAASPAACLKKQTQSGPSLIDAKSFVEKDYGNGSRPDAAENKPKQSQFHKPASGKGAEKRACRKVPCG